MAEPTGRKKVVGSDAEGQRLDRFLAGAWPDYSRTWWQRALIRGAVTVNGKPQPARYRLSPKDVVAAVIIAEKLPVIEPHGDDEDANRLIVYRDDAILVVNKPRHVVVHPSPGHWDDSLVHRLMSYLPRSEGDLRPGVVHRLDRDTSGLMIMARGPQIRERLSEAIRQRKVHRQYLAVVRGHLLPFEGCIEAPIGRDPANRLKMGVVYGGREARTTYRTLAQWRHATLVQCTLDTGRTHQIRVHMASLGHPVIGDPLYGGRMDPFIEGQMLHAGRLAFSHPLTQEMMSFDASPPGDWSLLNGLGPAEVMHATLYRDETGAATLEFLRDLGIGILGGGQPQGLGQRD